MSGNVVELTDGNFDAEALQADQPVLVDFWAPWCGPCRMVGPIIEELAGAYAGKVKVGKLNTDHNPVVASKYGIRSIPTILLLKDGQVVGNLLGAMAQVGISKDDRSSPAIGSPAGGPRPPSLGPKDRP